jgi:hypothetical protein
MTRDDLDYMEERLLSVSKSIHDTINDRAARHAIIDENNKLQRIISHEQFLEEALESADAEIMCFLADCEDQLDEQSTKLSD